MIMRILMIHNYYQQRGGEDESVDADIALLRGHGHDVVTYTRHNDEIKAMPALARLALPLTPTWSRRSAAAIGKLVRAQRPDVVHIQNTFPLISAAAAVVADRENLPVLCTLRNYRHLCPAATCFRKGAVCEKCLAGTPWWAAFHRCYRGALIPSASAALMVATHRHLDTWINHATLFVTLSAFAGDVFARAGFPADRIRVRPNFLDAPAPAPDRPRRGVVYVGRLSEEKGIRTLLDAWQATDGIPLTVIGDGPLRALVEERAAGSNGAIACAGRQTRSEVQAALGSARICTMPSEWYETFGRTIMEAFAAATPVVASDLGCMAEWVRGRNTGLLYAPGDATALAACVNALYSDTDRLLEMGKAARLFFETHCSPGKALRRAEDLYAEAISLAQETDRTP